MNCKEVLAILKKQGWEIQAGGRHVKARKGQQRVPIPTYENKDIKLGTLKSIEKLTGVNLIKRGE